MSEKRPRVQCYPMGATVCGIRNGRLCLNGKEVPMVDSWSLSHHDLDEPSTPTKLTMTLWVALEGDRRLG